MLGHLAHSASPLGQRLFRELTPSVPTRKSTQEYEYSEYLVLELLRRTYEKGTKISLLVFLITQIDPFDVPLILSLTIIWVRQNLS